MGVLLILPSGAEEVETQLSQDSLLQLAAVVGVLETPTLVDYLVVREGERDLIGFQLFLVEPVLLGKETVADYTTKGSHPLSGLLAAAEKTAREEIITAGRAAQAVLTRCKQVAGCFMPAAAAAETKTLLRAVVVLVLVALVVEVLPANSLSQALSIEVAVAAAAEGFRLKLGAVVAQAL